MKLISFLFVILFSINALATIRIAVVDSGYNTSQNTLLCTYGHMDLTKTGFKDNMNHGKYITDLIQQHAHPAKNFCLIIIKVFDPNSPTDSGKNVLKALKYLTKMTDYVDIINLSLGGQQETSQETILVKQLLDKNIKIFAAAGNENYNLDQKCNFYPGCSDNRIVLVGCLRPNGKKCKTSNYGNVIKSWQKVPYSFGGTSFATAITTGKYIKKILHHRKLKSDQNRALEKIAEASYYQFNIDNYIQKKKKQILTPDIEKIAGWIIWSANSYSNEKIIINHKWEF